MFERLPDRVDIVEVGPRDGLQNERAYIATTDKLVFIEKLLGAGIQHIEVASFVRPERIPQMADGGKLLPPLLEGRGGQDQDKFFFVLVPNLQGLTNALAAGAQHFSLLTAVSETFSQKNTNASVDQSLQRIREIIKQLDDPLKCKSRVYISTVFGCPYEGEVTTAQVVSVVEKLLSMGLGQIVLGDTIGVATPRQVDGLLRDLAQVMDLRDLGLHFHDTWGLALPNILVGLEHGITSYDSSVAGLGGCPYAPGATGNVATEDVVYLMDSLGVATGIDLKKLAAAGAFMLERVGRPSSCKVYNALQGQSGPL